MSGHEDVLERVALSSAERGRARRFLVGICLAFLGLGLVQWTEGAPLRWLTWGLILPGMALMLFLPKDSGIPMIPRNLRRIARTAGMPELGMTAVVYTCVIAGFASATAGFIVTIATH